MRGVLEGWRGYFILCGLILCACNLGLALVRKAFRIEHFGKQVNDICHDHLQDCASWVALWLCLFGVWFVCFWGKWFCLESMHSRSDHLSSIDGLMNVTHRRRVGVKSSQPVHSSSYRTNASMVWKLVFVVVLGGTCRIGEAAVPGPADHGRTPEWKIGVANPSGLNGKAHLVSEEVDVWCICETHLTAQGFRAFRNSLRSNKSPFSSMAQGVPVAPRSTASDIGIWSGVAVMAQHPVRSLPQSWEQSVSQTGRIMVVSILCKGVWISGVVVYGTPCGPTHPRARQTTNALLELALRRVASLTGPRFVAGDFNHEISTLECHDMVGAMSFRDVQDLHFESTGVPPRATCKNKTRRDYLLISPELQSLFVQCEVFDDAWPDHSPVVATFRGGPSDLVRYSWHVPNQIPWQKFSSRQPSPVVDFEQANDCSELYRQWWKSIEGEIKQEGRSGRLPSACFGRGQLVEPRKLLGNSRPVCIGRGGDFEPRFLGVNWTHAMMVKQVRRIQSFARLQGVENVTNHHRVHSVGLWNSILSAKGFRPSFRVWWTSLELKVGEPENISVEPPTEATAWMVYNVLVRELEVFEGHLKKHKSYVARKLDKDRMQRVFDGVRRDMPVQVETLLQTQTSTIKEVDVADSAIVVDPPRQWVDRVPIVCQGEAQIPIFAEQDKIWMQNVEQCQVGDPVVQNRAIGRLEDVFTAFTEQWQQRWGRHADVPVSQWQEILDFVDAQFPRLSFGEHEVSPAAIRACAQTKKKRAATGLDGVSRQDILNFHEDHFQSLASLYRRAEGSGAWPTQTVVGAVRSLAKVATPQDVVDYRPVTVFSIIYRLWSSVQSRWFLTALNPHMDAMMFGNRAGHQASQLWRYVLDRVEGSQLDNHPICGLVVDLSKAFNTLPRYPTMVMASRLGLPFRLLTAWSGMLGSMQRRFVVRGSLSPAVFSTCGYPEGCGLSCLAMMIIDHAFALWLRALSPSIVPLTFVDNWEVIATEASQISLALESVLRFAKLLDLTVDTAKTFTWGSNRQVRAELKSSGHRVVTDGLDLGAHMVYTKQVRNSALVRRLEALQDFWDKLKVVCGSHDHKIRAIRTVAWVRGLHGVSAVILGAKHWTRLRTQAMRSLGLEKPNASPMLQLAAEADGSDPQHFAILCTIRDFRAFGCTPVQLGSLDKIGAGITVHAQGSINAVLCHRLHQLGWIVGCSGIVTDSFGSFSLHESNILEINWRVQYAWHKVVSQHVQKRLGFEHFHRVDVGATRRAISKLTALERGGLWPVLNGTGFTHAHAYKWSTTGSDLCCRCNQPDSLYHRYWTCPWVADLRMEVDPEVRHLIPSLPQCLTVHSWSLQSTCFDMWWNTLLAIPDTVEKPLVDLQGDGCLDFFTDGSCFWGDEPSWRTAAWSVVLASPCSVTPTAWKAELVGAQPVSGLAQTSFRAELRGLLAALEYTRGTGRPVRIWCDCLGVISRYRLLVHDGLPLKVNNPHHDLWTRVLDLVDELGTNNVQVAKVDAHLDVGATDNLVEAWLIVNNAVADHAAKRANSERTSLFWHHWQQHVDSEVRMRHVAHEIRQHQVKVNHRWISSKQPTGVNMPEVPIVRRAKTFTSKWIAPNHRLTPLPSFVKAVGSSLATKVFSWWQNCLDPEADLSWVSFAQLYLSFQIEQHHAGPLRQGRKWVDSGQYPTTPEAIKFRVRCKYFRLMMQCLWKIHGWSVGRGTLRPCSQVLSCHIGCSSIPIKLERLRTVERWLEQNVQGTISGLGVQLDRLPPAW